MFEWKIEELKLYHQKGGIILGKEKIYDCEYTVSREDKIAFVDGLQDGKLSYILNLFEKFKEDEENLPKDKWGDVKTVSLKSWIKRNDTRKLIDDTYTYGKIRFIGGRSIKSVNIKSAYDTYDDYVDEVFHRQLKECENKEREYFLEHDEYSILKREFLNNKYNTTFGVNITSWSSGKVCICDDVTKEEREITIEELKYLLSRYKELDELVEKITKETHITY